MSAPYRDERYILKLGKLIESKKVMRRFPQIEVGVFIPQNPATNRRAVPIAMRRLIDVVRVGATGFRMFVIQYERPVTLGVDCLPLVGKPIGRVLKSDQDKEPQAEFLSFRDEMIRL
jgi:hypothetical protein